MEAVGWTRYQIRLRFCYEVKKGVRISGRQQAVSATHAKKCSDPTLRSQRANSASPPLEDSLPYSDEFEWVNLRAGAWRRGVWERQIGGGLF